MIARANGLLNHEEPHLSGVSTTVVTSTYPRELSYQEVATTMT